MASDMLEGWDTSTLPGAPIPGDFALEAAVGAVRSLLGWHLAPEVTETLVVDSPGGQRLWLPTRHVVEVTEVRVCADDGTETPLTGWNAATGWSEGGWLYCLPGFPAGERRIRVDIVHGYAKAPAEIVAVVVAGLAAQVKSETVGGRSVTISDSIGTGPSAAAIIARYALGPRP